jgi:hypothetical protein
MWQEREQNIKVRTNVRVDLLEAGKARVGLERHGQCFNPFKTDRVAREAVGVWT